MKKYMSWCDINYLSLIVR